ncbi:MAG: hypothetical protein WC467_00395 [Patescibacteria group bacterium]
MRPRFFASIVNILSLCIVIAGVSIYFINESHLMGYIMIGLALVCLVSLRPFKISFKATLPDIFFGMIDNGILAVLAIFGGHFAGVTGAVMGGVVGNAITDGIAGIFEGRAAETLRARLVPEERTMLKSAVGKMAGCLLGAGVVLIIDQALRF